MMALGRHVVEVYQEYLETINTEIEEYGETVLLTNENGKIIIKDGFINHFGYDSTGGEWQDRIMNFAILVANKQINYRRTPDEKTSWLD